MNRRLAITAVALIIVIAVGSIGTYITFYSKPEKVTPDADSIVWQTQLDPETSQYTVADGRVFLTNTQGYIYGYNLTNGERIWKTYLGGQGYHPIVEANGKLYTYGGGSLVVRVDGETGNGEVEYSLPQSYDYSLYVGNPSFIIEDNKMVCSYQNEAKVVFNLQTGELLWSTDLKHGLRVYNTTTSGVGQLYIDGSKEGTIRAIDLNNGQNIWSISGYGGIELTEDRVILLNYASLEAHQEVVLSGGYPKEYDILCLNRTTGQELWKYTPRYLVFNPTIYKNSLIFASYDGCYYQLNIENGTIDWKTLVTDLSANSTLPLCECLTIKPFVDENNNRICWGIGAYKNGNSPENGEFSLRSLNLQDGSENWVSSSASVFMYEVFGESNIAVNGNQVFLAKYSWARCFDSSSGTICWVRDYQQEPLGPLLADDKVIVATDRFLLAYK